MTKSHHNSGTDADTNGDTPMDPFLSLLDSSHAVDKDQWLVPVDHGSSIDRSGSPADDGILMAYEKMAPFCAYLEPWKLHDPTTQVYYLVNRVKAFTSDVAERNSTPFMHARLYTDHTPPCILDCFATNVLYTNRNPRNIATVMQALYRNVRALIGTEAGRVIVTPAEKLACTQALFLYQVIRLFDGDVTLRAQGEHDIPLLRTWLGDLCRVRENLGDIAKLGGNAVKAQPPKEWKRWIFAESVRRTIVMAYSVLTLYGMMKYDADTWEYTHRWTLSRHLWEADSSSTFYRMWSEKPHFIISNFSFEDFLEHGRGDDVDEFAVILLNG
ncbi:uncharacterized protein DNG_02123 [Cephalotrichum gorgonifer]|uniref:Uncharacterized protein n=1 Tax=Cephalotrichum gorgonifer TaxID=2041049 RepID=A0AAE8MUM6_9PEZI|nr:uncharacterized protein DNG_02123 [Cephalotrichum gorgonifer]